MKTVSIAILKKLTQKNRVNDAKVALAVQMTAYFAHTELYPGKATTLEIRADQGSLCAIGIIDKSVHLLRGPHRLTVDTVRIEHMFNSNDNSFIECIMHYYLIC